MKVTRPDGKQAHTIVDATALLSAAQSKYEAADATYREASHARTAALNVLNEAQKVVDAAVNDLRGFAPIGSDWKSDRSVATI